LGGGFVVVDPVTSIWRLLRRPPAPAQVPAPNGRWMRSWAGHELLKPIG
jgi:hypothetical protein